ncbi:MAG: glycerophosphodiester phosphodiesterase [Anaerolineae bacterium]|nr:glycerophosphodiester phosphodiesterase [Anaerolineae bacterium]
MLDYIYRGRQLNVAHRGASAATPENTLAAFRAAMDAGADGVELDVQLSADGVPVIHHDFDLGRTDTGNGPLREQTLAQLRRLDAGGWKDARFTGERIPTLAEVFALLDRQMLVNVELKSRSSRGDGLEAAVFNAIQRAHMTDRVIVSSFNPFALMRFRDLAAGIPLGLLYSPDLPVHLRRTWLRPAVRPEALHPRHDMVDANLMTWAHKSGYRVNTWTVDDPAEMRRLLDLGVDAIITNVPDVLRAVMAEARPG